MMKGVTKMAEYLMGIDAGTGSVRVALFDFRIVRMLLQSMELLILKMDGQSRATTNGLRH